ncbi:alginate O-acetyltransferase AlgX-related protein [Deinococcus irradiatisoli]|nr:hypothetical protein [Deinococcus irradiatisoli]
MNPCTPQEIEANPYLGFDLVSPQGWIYQSYTFTPPPIFSEGDLAFALELRSVLANHGTELIVVPVPNKPAVAAAEAAFDPAAVRAKYLREVAGLRGRYFTVVDVLTPALTHWTDPETGLNFYPRTDSHWTTSGAKLIAEQVGEVIRRSPQYASMPKIDYQLASQPTTRLGNLGAQLNKYCAAHFLPEPERAYTVSKPEQHLDLLAPLRTPVAVAGTSFSSVEEMHFADFIGAATRLEVVNYSESGGGKFLGLLNFLKSENFKDNPPSFLVWEFPNNYGPLQDDELQQLRAALHR